MGNSVKLFKSNRPEYSGVVQRAERPPVKREVAGAEPATRAINSDKERGKK